MAPECFVSTSFREQPFHLPRPVLSILSLSQTWRGLWGQAGRGRGPGQPGWSLQPHWAPGEGNMVSRGALPATGLRRPGPTPPRPLCRLSRSNTASTWKLGGPFWGSLWRLGRGGSTEWLSEEPPTPTCWLAQARQDPSPSWGTASLLWRWGWDREELACGSSPPGNKGSGVTVAAGTVEGDQIHRVTHWGMWGRGVPEEAGAAVGPRNWWS